MAYLENYEVIASKNLTEMQAMLAQLTETHQVDVIGKGHEINASLRSAAFGELSLMHVDYGNVPTRVQTHEIDRDMLLLFVMTRGNARVLSRGKSVDISPEVALMRDARLPLLARQQSFASYVAPLPVQLLKKHAETLHGLKGLEVDLNFNLTFDLNTPSGRHLRNTVDFIAQALDGPFCGVDNAIIFNGFQDLLLTSVLFLDPGFSDLYMQNHQPRTAIPYYIKRARDYIHAHIETAITLDDLAKEAGCGYRTLQLAFNEYFGMSPIAYINHVRLSMAHQELTNADAGVNVRDVALRWGFAHFGWFAKKYKDQFGVTPSQTLRLRG